MRAIRSFAIAGNTASSARKAVIRRTTCCGSSSTLPRGRCRRRIDSHGHRHGRHGGIEVAGRVQRDVRLRSQALRSVSWGRVRSEWSRYSRQDSITSTRCPRFWMNRTTEGVFSNGPLRFSVKCVEASLTASAELTTAKDWLKDVPQSGTREMGSSVFGPPLLLPEPMSPKLDKPSMQVALIDWFTSGERITSNRRSGALRLLLIDPRRPHGSSNTPVFGVL